MKVHDKFLFRKFFHQYIKQFFLFSFIFVFVVKCVWILLLLKKRVTYFRHYFLSLYNKENHQIYKWIFLILSIILLLNVFFISFIIIFCFFNFLMFLCLCRVPQTGYAIWFKIHLLTKKKVSVFRFWSV